MPRELIALSLDTIKDVCPLVAAQWAAFVKQLSVDCHERPIDKTARSVTLQVNVKPVTDDKGNLDRVILEFQMKSSLPKAVSDTFPMIPTREGFKFNAEVPEQLGGQRLNFDPEETPGTVRRADDDELRPERAGD